MRAPLVFTATACAALRAAAVRRLRPTRRLINMRGLDAFAAAADASWTRSLNADPESKQHEPNKSSRRVKSGHYVPVVPTALQSPELKLHSRELCEELGLTEADVKDERFARFFSGDVAAARESGAPVSPWAQVLLPPRARKAVDNVASPVSLQAQLYCSRPGGNPHFTSTVESAHRKVPHRPPRQRRDG